MKRFILGDSREQVQTDAVFASLPLAPKKLNA